MDFEEDGWDTQTRAEVYHERALDSMKALETLKSPYRTTENVDYIDQRIRRYAALATMEYARMFVMSKEKH